MSTAASTLVERAKEWAGNYGKYANGVEGAVITVPLRIRAAWGNGDADAFADMFTEDGSLVVGDETLSGREEIRRFIAEAFLGDYQASTLDEQALEIRLLAPDVALAVMEGGITPQGGKSSGQHRAVYVTVKRDGDWRLLNLQTNPVKD